MKREKLEEYISRVKRESKFDKYLREDIIYKFIDIFNNNYEKKEYPMAIENPLKMALDFYKYYNKKYYDILIEGINNKKIIINENTTKSFLELENNKLFISLFENDCDIFMLVHEFAHYIDRNNNLIPDKYYFLSEVFSFYMEKQLSIYLKDKKYDNLIQIRKDNRKYYESKMLTAIKYELFYETLYKEKGKIKKEDLDNNEVKFIMRYDYDLNTGLINSLMLYPLANILSEYLIDNDLLKNDSDICKICLNTNLYELLEEIKKHK